MLRQKLIYAVTTYGGVISPILLVIGLAILLALPSIQINHNFIDENAISHRAQHLASEVNASMLAQSAEIGSPSVLVRGLRSPGTEVVAIYVNTAAAASVQIANLLITNLRRATVFGCDILFYFVSDDEEWPIPQSYARAALVLNISSLSSDRLCLDLYGKHGLQPNQDLPNTVLRAASHEHLLFSLLCQTNRWAADAELSALAYYLTSALNAMRLPLYPQRWHEIPTRGIATVAISTNPMLSHLPPRTATTSRNRGESVETGVARTLVSFLVDTVSSLNSLEERFHHANFVYMPCSDSATVPFEVAQCSIFMFIGTIISTCYAWYQRDGFRFSPLVALALGATTPVADQVYKAAGPYGLAAVSALFAIAFHRAEWNTTWMSLNAAAIGLMEGLQPATGLLGGAAVAIQQLFFHPAMGNSLLLLAIGAAASWVLWGGFIFYAGLPMWSLDGVSLTFVSLLLYPNAVWVSARLVHSVLAAFRASRHRRRQSPVKGGVKAD